MGPGGQTPGVAGPVARFGVLHFTPERARWIANELWHPKQKGYEKDGANFLEVPYSDNRELVMDILKYGPDVEVLAPEALRVKVLEYLSQATDQYRKQGDRITP